MKQEYSTLLKSPKWQKKRLEILERDNWTCQHCGDTESELHVHHKYYEKDIDPWDYDDYCLITLCGSCHQKKHDAMSDSYSIYLEAKDTFSKIGFSSSLFNSMLKMLDRAGKNIKNGSCNDYYTQMVMSLMFNKVHHGMLFNDAEIALKYGINTIPIMEIINMDLLERVLKRKEDDEV